MPNKRPRHLALVANPSPAAVGDDRARQRAPKPFVRQYAELLPVLSRALLAVVDALELGEETPADVIAELEDAAATAMTEVYAPIALAASRLAASTQASRSVEAASVRKRAEELAAVVAETATVLQQRHDRIVERVAEEAAAAAQAKAACSVPGFKFEAKIRAVQEAITVRKIAAARADQRATAAAMAAAAAEQAAVRLASQAEHAAVTVHRDAVQAAASVRATALDVVYEIAIDAACRRFALVSTRGPHHSGVP